MFAEQFYSERNDRQIRYAGRVLDDKKYICLQPEADYVSQYDGQVALITLANLLSRMTPSLALDIPEANIVSPLPWAGKSLPNFILEQIKKNDPHNRFSLRKKQPDDYTLNLGWNSGAFNIHGTGWHAFVGDTPSPLQSCPYPNPIGPAFAAILAAGHLFRTNLQPITGTQTLNAFSWSEKIDDSDNLAFAHAPELGDIWFIGAGSVGTSAIYFLPFLTQDFTATIVDMDYVKEHNLDRSPIFSVEDAYDKRFKAKVAAHYLRETGICNVDSKTVALHQTEWLDRDAGTPDLVVSAANEQNVRYHIEQGLPPIQIYGTTGKNWQSSLFVHVPMQGECSCCVFPPETPKPLMRCAEGRVVHEDSGEEIDASLPFLSFAAGLMSVAEILKLSIKKCRIHTKRVMLQMSDNYRVLSISKPPRTDCLCANRSRGVHQKMISGSKYDVFSDVNRTAVSNHISNEN